MKKSISIILAIIIVLVSIPVVFAFYDDSNTPQDDIVETELNNQLGYYFELTENEIVTKKKINLPKVEYSTEIMKCMNLIEDSSVLDSMNVKYYENKIDERIESVFDNGKMKIRFNTTTGDFISFSKKLEDDYPDSKITEDEVKEKAIRLFSSLNYENYELVDLYPFDDDIWLVQFAKIEDDGLINIGSSIKFSFVGETDEILTLNVFDFPYENNEILITRDVVDSIASEYNKFDLSYEISLKIVNPNDYWTSLSQENCLSEKYYRKAYVITFADNQQTQVFVDATTGKVIGGNMILGGTKYEK